LLAYVCGVLREIGSGLLWQCHQLAARNGRLIKSSWARQQPQRTKHIIDQGVHTTSAEACLGSRSVGRRHARAAIVQAQEVIPHDVSSWWIGSTTAQRVDVDPSGAIRSGQHGSCGGCKTVVVGLRHDDLPHVSSRCWCSRYATTHKGARTLTSMSRFSAQATMVRSLWLSRASVHRPGQPCQ
jgi:hypothetical protein